MKKKRVELIGIGHPLADGLISFMQNSSRKGEVTCMSDENLQNEKPKLIARILITVEGEAKHNIKEVKIIQIDHKGQVNLLSDDWDLNILKDRRYKIKKETKGISCPWNVWKESYHSAIIPILTQTRLKIEKPISARVQLLGLSVLF